MQRTKRQRREKKSTGRNRSGSCGRKRQRSESWGLQKTGVRQKTGRRQTSTRGRGRSRRQGRSTRASEAAKYKWKDVGGGRCLIYESAAYLRNMLLSCNS